MTVERSHLRVREIVDLLGTSERTIRRWLTDGTLPSVKIGGTRLVARADLDRLLDGVRQGVGRQQQNTDESRDYMFIGKA